MQRLARGLPIAAVVLCAAWAALPTEATMVKPFNFDEMVRRAGRAFTGTLTGIEEGTTAEGAPYIAYTFTVSESFKGDVGSTITVRQFGLGTPQLQDVQSIRAFNVPGMPTYKRGEQVLLLLSSESSIGLSAPIGLFQGVFRLNRNAAGEILARNGSDNVNLFKDMTGIPAALKNHRRGPIKLSLLIDRINQSQRGRGRR